LLSAALLAGCDSINQTGTDFLAANGITVSSRDSFSTMVPVQSVKVLPVEGVPAVNGQEGLWLGGSMGDSVRAVVAFDLHYASAKDAALYTILDSTRLAKRFPLTRLAFDLGSGDTDSVVQRKVHARFLFLDSGNVVTDKNQTKYLPALFMGVEPSALGLTVFHDTSVVFTPSLSGGIPLGAVLRDSLAARLSDSSGGVRTWLVVILDGHPGWNQIHHLSDPRLRTDSTAGSLLPGQFQDNAAWRSSEQRSASASSRSLGWWVGGGRRLRVSIDGDSLRSILHQHVGASTQTDSFDNSFNILQARVRVPFSSFRYYENSSDDRGISTAGSVVLANGPESRAGTADSARIPIALGSDYLTQLGLTTNPVLHFVGTFPGVVQGSIYEENTLYSIPTRMSLGMGSSSSYTTQNFWLRTDVADSVEFRISSLVRVSVARDAGSSSPVRVNWSYLKATPVADAQTGVDSTRAESRLRTVNTSSQGYQVRQEIRSSISLAAIQKKFSVDIDLIPEGGSLAQHDLWESVPAKSSIMDSLRLIVRPRNGSAL
jgi:hypothetical protein